MAQAGAIGTDLGIAADTEESLSNLINKALEAHDIVLLTGGVSMGDFDHVPAIMEKAGVEILFKTIAIQPGKPTVFGARGINLFSVCPETRSPRLFCLKSW